MAQNRNDKLPDFILNAPELPACDDLLFYAFIDLDTCRPVGFSGSSSIPFLSIVQYAQYLGFEGEELTEFVNIMVLADNLLMKKVAAEKKD